MIHNDCTEACAAMPRCLTCHKTKPPRGRDVGVIAANGYCGHDCPGFREEPLSGHLWPEEWADHVREMAGEKETE